MRIVAFASVFLITSAAFALDIRSTGFSTLTDRLGLPAGVDETKTFGSDSWWGGGVKFGPWGLSSDSKPEAMGEYMWTGQLPAWDETKWGGNLFYTGSSDYGGFIVYRRGEIVRNTDEDTTLVRAEGTVEIVDKESGSPIGTEPFWLNFMRTKEQIPTYAPAARFNDESESALYHVLDAALERRFFAGEYTNQTWATATYGPRNPKTAWFHLSDDPDDPLGDNPRRECYYSPQPGVELTDSTNRVIFTRRFAEYGNIISNFPSASYVYDACDNRLHYPTVGTMPDETLWSSSYLWRMWEHAAPQEVTSWKNATEWGADYWPSLMPCIRGLQESRPFSMPNVYGYQNRFIFPEDHCFGHQEIVDARKTALGLDKNQQGRLLLPAYPDPIALDCAGFIASNYSISAYHYLSNSWTTSSRPSRRFDPTFLAGWSQWLALLNKTQTTSANAMDTTRNVARGYQRRVDLDATLELSVTSDMSAVSGGWEVNDDIILSDHLSQGWEVTLATNTIYEAEYTNAAPQKCSAWVHLDTPTDNCVLNCETYSFGVSLSGDDLSSLLWSITPTNGTDVVITHSCHQSVLLTDWYERLTCGEAQAEFKIDIPYGSIWPHCHASTSRRYTAETSRHTTTDFQFQPGPNARQGGVVGNAELWGFHTFALKNNHFGRVWGVLDSFSTMLHGTYFDPANIEASILTPWYTFVFEKLAAVTGFLDPWERIDYARDISAERLASAYLPRGSFFRFQETAASSNTKILADIEWPTITITGYIDPYGVTNRGEYASITWEVLPDDLSSSRPQPGTNEFPRVPAISADAKSTVTQVIDWNFNSLKPISTGND